MKAALYKEKHMEEEQTALLVTTEKTTESHDQIKSWALVELFGHQRIIGFLSEQNFGTGVLFRVDVPDLTKEGKVVRKGFTRYFGLSSIYSITPIDEQTVRELLLSISGSPAVRPFSIRSSNDDEGWQ